MFSRHLLIAWYLYCFSQLLVYSPYFPYIMHQRPLNNLPILSYFILNLIEAEGYIAVLVVNYGIFAEDVKQDKMIFTQKCIWNVTCKWRTSCGGLNGLMSCAPKYWYIYMCVVIKILVHIYVCGYQNTGTYICVWLSKYWYIYMCVVIKILVHIYVCGYQNTGTYICVWLSKYWYIYMCVVIKILVHIYVCGYQNTGTYICVWLSKYWYIYMCVVIEAPHIHCNEVSWNCTSLDLDAALGRWGRHVTAGLMMRSWLLSTRQLSGCRSRNPDSYHWGLSAQSPSFVYMLRYAIALSIACFIYPVGWIIFVSVIICWLLLHPL